MRAVTCRFQDFRLSLAAHELWRADARLVLPPRVLACLCHLIEQRERAVGRDELIRAVWHRDNVSDIQLGQLILRARRAVGDEGTLQHSIRTVVGFGYRWVAPTETEAAVPAEPFRTTSRDDELDDERGAVARTQDRPASTVDPPTRNVLRSRRPIRRLRPRDGPGATRSRGPLWPRCALQGCCCSATSLRRSRTRSSPRPMRASPCCRSRSMRRTRTPGCAAALADAAAKIAAQQGVMFGEHPCPQGMTAAHRQRFRVPAMTYRVRRAAIGYRRITEPIDT